MLLRGDRVSPRILTTAMSQQADFTAVQEGRWALRSTRQGRCQRRCARPTGANAHRLRRVAAGDQLRPHVYRSGSGPLIAAAGAWDALAADIGAAASGYRTVIAELTSLQWSGPASAAMLAAVTPYVTWLCATAARAEQAGMQARAAAAAYETAFAMTVPPPLIAANRVRLMVLVATNFFGQNTP